jgi:hypothetical protein
MIKRNEVPPELLAAAENYLNITWNDQATDDKVCGLIASGTAYLDLKVGDFRRGRKRNYRSRCGDYG